MLDRHYTVVSKTSLFVNPSNYSRKELTFTFLYSFLCCVNIAVCACVDSFGPPTHSYLQRLLCVHTSLFECIAFCIASIASCIDFGGRCKRGTEEDERRVGIR